MSENLSKPLFVLSGGQGSRLKSVVKDVPKSLAPINGIPFLEYLISSWVTSGIQNFVFLAGYRAYQIKEFVDKIKLQEKYRKISFDVITEEEPLGTGGAIANALKLLSIDGFFLVSNSDTWLSGDNLQPLLSETHSCIGVVYREDADRYGVVEIESGIVKKFSEKKYAPRGWINAGVYCLNVKNFSKVDAKAFSLEKDLLPLMAENAELMAVPLESSLVDIGLPQDYYKFCNYMRDHSE